MIEIFEGRIGGGKTYSAVCRILIHFAKGGSVFTNVDLLWPGCAKYCAKHYGVEIEPEQLTMLTEDQIDELQRYLMAGSSDMPVLCVIDEAQLWFNAKDHREASRAMLTFLTQSRKVDIDLIFITQSALNINAQFRRLGMFVWRFRDLKKFSIMGIPWPFNQILAIQLDEQGKTVMNKTYVSKSKEIFDCYNTKSLLRPIDFNGHSLAKRNLKKIKKPPVSILKLVRNTVDRCDYRLGWVVVGLSLVVIKFTLVQL